MAPHPGKPSSLPPNPSNILTTHTEASPPGQTDGHRAAHDSAVVSSLRSALRDVYERYKAYKERSETLEAEATRKLSAYTAETAGMLRQWGGDPNINGGYVETQLQARNGQYKSMEGREADRQINNRASFEADLLSILEDIVNKDGKILEVCVAPSIALRCIAGGGCSLLTADCRGDPPLGILCRLMSPR